MNRQGGKLGIPDYWAWFVLPALVIFAIGFIRASADTVDDAYISFRAVLNFLNGEGLAFNPNDLVESYSNPLFVFILIPIMGIGIPPELAAMVIGLASFAAIIPLTYWTIWNFLHSDLFAVAGACACLGCFPLLYYSVTGLETGFYAALIIGAVYLTLREEGLSWRSAALWLAVGLSRPEGPAYPVFLLPVLLWQREKLPQNLGWWAAIMAGIALHAAWRYWYYGLLLPNTFYAKPAGTADLDIGTTHFQASSRYLFNFLLSTGFIVPLAAIPGAVKTWQVRGPNVLISSAAAGVLFALYTGGDWFPAGRYFLPAVPLLIALGLIGGHAVYTKFKSERAEFLIAGGLFASSLAGTLSPLSEFHLFRQNKPYHIMNSADAAAVGVWLRDNTEPGDLIAAYRIGALGYYSGRRIYDLHGLAHHHIARTLADHPDYTPSTRMGDNLPVIYNELNSEPPEYVMPINSAGEADPSQIGLYGHVYDYVRKFPQGEDQFYLLYEYSGMTIEEAIEAAEETPEK